MRVGMDFEETMRAQDGHRHYWSDAPEDTKRRFRAKAWCIAHMRDRSWFYRDGEVPAWVPEAAMSSRDED